jgi:four helix bundle protein
MEEKSKIKNIEDFIVYQKATKLFDDFLEVDLPILKTTFEGKTLAGNQLRCLDSICANMEEGFDRKWGNETKNFFRMSKGSSAEARGRYKRIKKLLPAEIAEQRISILNEIRAMLDSLIKKWN